MTKLTPNCALEMDSKTAFMRLMSPWQCNQPTSDIGIDYIVQPLDKRGEETINFERRFLVQLKSQGHVGNKPKISIDVKHLLDWSRQKDSVMIALYCAHSKQFFFIWLDQISIIEKQKVQTIYLTDNFKEENKDKVMENILRHINPMNVSRYCLFPPQSIRVKV